jgi:hypothetical protein
MDARLPKRSRAPVAESRVSWGPRKCLTASAPTSGLARASRTLTDGLLKAVGVDAVGQN